MHFDNPIFILLILAAGLFRWLAQRAEQKRKKSGDPNESTRQVETAAPARGGEQTEAERVRRFLEALGQPTNSKPPPKIEPRKLVEPRPVIANFPPITPTLPPLTTAPPPLTQQSTSAPQPITTVTPTQIAPTRTREPAVFEVATVQPTTKPKAGGDATRSGLTSSRSIGREQTSLAARLTTPEGLRDAIVVREIFGAPRSLQTIDGMGGL